LLRSYQIRGLALGRFAEEKKGDVADPGAEKEVDLDGKDSKKKERRGRHEKNGDESVHTENGIEESKK